MGSALAVLRWKFVTLNPYIRKEEGIQINNLKKLEKEEQVKLSVTRRKEIMKIRVKSRNRKPNTTEKNQWNTKLVL